MKSRKTILNIMGVEINFHSLMDSLEQIILLVGQAVNNAINYKRNILNALL